MTDALKNFILFHDRSVPRYTSYPPATRFTTGFSAVDYATALATAGRRLSLYIHVPFCAKLCHYCGCHMRVVNSYDPVIGYLDLLPREAELTSAFLPDNSMISEIHFGGGSPTLIAATDFTRLIDRLRSVLPVAPDATISIEADPRTISEAKIAAYATAGVRRLSLGVQDFNEGVMKSVNRSQPYHLTRDAVNLARDYGIESINFDLMYGLPGQSVESIRDTMAMAVALRPDRVAFFGYAHVPWVKKHMRLMPEDRLPDAGLRYDLFRAGGDVLTEAGYTPVGIDHFARPGDNLARMLEAGEVRRNFQGYTTDQCDALIGLGPSSISALPGLYAQNTTNFPAYREAVMAGRLPVARGYAMQGNDAVYARVIESLMCNLCVDLDHVARTFGCDPAIFGPALERITPYVADGFVRVDGFSVIIDSDARLLARLVCAVFDEYVDHTDSALPRHARAV